MSDVALQSPVEDFEGVLPDSEILTEVVMALVRNPDKVNVEYERDGDMSKYMIYVAPEDIGKVIGKSGETVSLLRKLFGRIAAARHERIAIDVYDPSKANPGRPFRSRVA